MPTEASDDNKAYCKDYYRRLKQDPAKWKAFLDKRSRYKKSRRPVNPCETCEPEHTETVNPCEPEQPVNPPEASGGKHAASSTGYHGMPPEALIDQHHEQWDKQAEDKRLIQEFLSMLSK